jgi:hypothetical protein
LKRVVDLYLAIVAKRQWPALVKSAKSIKTQDGDPSLAFPGDGDSNP